MGEIMEANRFSRHISGQFNEDLEAVRNHVLSMGGLVEQQLNQALAAISKQDTRIAANVVEGDREVNKLEISIDEECARIIAKRQPAASDLRLIMAIVKVIVDLERIGDEAKRVAGVATQKHKDSMRGFLLTLEALGQKVLSMLHQTLDAFARIDANAAYRVHMLDDEIDSEYKKCLNMLTDNMMSDSESVPLMMEMMWSARALERIGDRCQNIAEYIIYFVLGKDVRHLSRDDLRKEFQV